MKLPSLSRRAFIAASAGAALPNMAFALQTTAVAADPNLILTTRPTRIFKTRDRSNEATESWIFSLLLQTPIEMTLELVELETILTSGGNAVARLRYEAEACRALSFRTAMPPRLPDGSAPAIPFHWPTAVRIRQQQPVALNVDGMLLSVQARDGAGATHSAILGAPIHVYAQRTELSFPFRGKGIILQAGATNGGHRNTSGQFAIDALGLDESWSVIAPGDGSNPSDYRGWGREILAPATGRIVRLRKDRPDQPVADVSDPAYFVPEFPDGGDPGNHMIIDHGQGEYSMLAHFQAGSIRHEPGAEVTRGELLGRLGNSGDSTGPHLHYQLQAGPDWEYADALPCRFVDVAENFLVRGTFFEPRVPAG